MEQLTDLILNGTGTILIGQLLLLVSSSSGGCSSSNSSSSSSRCSSGSHTHSIYAHTHTHTHTCKGTLSQPHTHTHTFEHKHVQMYTHTHTSSHIFKYVLYEYRLITRWLTSRCVSSAHSTRSASTALRGNVRLKPYVYK